MSLVSGTVLAAMMAMAMAQHHHVDPFAGSNCTCDTFCANKCAINATAPAVMTTYRMTPAGVLDMVNKNTGDVGGDTSFVLSRRTTAFECRHATYPSIFCKGMTQFDGDDANSTDLIEEFEIMVDGQWGPYLYCNPVNSSEPHGPWDCTVDLGGGGGPNPSPSPPQCTAANYSVFDGFCWEGSGTIVKASNVGECCAAAAAKNNARFSFWEANQTCALFPFAYHGYQCGASTGLHNFGPPPSPPCNCTRVHQTVGREDLDASGGMHYAAGGTWYSFPEMGQCTGNQKIGDNGCTWKVQGVKRTIMARCMYEHLDDNVEQFDPTCFSACPQPKNVTSDCYLQCYDTATNQMTHEQLMAPWIKSFSSTDPTQGGCPDAPKYLL